MADTSYDDISSCLIGDTIRVYVGPKRKRYTVHKALLTQYEWFRQKTYYTNYFNLPDEDPKVFELLINWLYLRLVKAISNTEEEVAKQEVELYIGLYLRACEWDMHELQNALMDCVRVRTTCMLGFFPRKLIKTIYAKTDSQSPLRSYIVDSFIYKSVEWDEDRYLADPIDKDQTLTRQRALKNQLDAGNQDFVLDCYEALFQLCAKSKIRDPDRRIGCVYHVHEEGDKC